MFEAWVPRLFAFVVIAMAFQGFLVGEELLDAFPDPSIDTDTETDSVEATIFGVTLFTIEVPNVLALILNIVLFPFQLAAWLLGVATLGPLVGFFPEVMRLILLPVQIFVGFFMVIVSFQFIARIMEMVGRFLPFT